MLDTTVASLLFSGLPLADLYRPEIAGRVLALSFQVEGEGELLSGADEKQWGSRRRAALAKFITDQVVVYPDAEVVRAWARLRARMRQAGRVPETADLWIAAVAVAKDAVLLSHDAVFRQVPGLRLVCHAPE